MEMAKRLKDEEKLYLFDGTLYPVVLCPAENMEALRTLRAGPDDLVLLSFPKCGGCYGVVRTSVSHFFPPPTQTFKR